VHPSEAVGASLRREMYASSLETVVYGGQDVDVLGTTWAMLGVEEGAVVKARWTTFEPLSDKTVKVAVEQWCHTRPSRDAVQKRHGHISHWNVSQVTSLANLFNNQKSFNEDISDWNVSNVQDTSFMFCNAQAFNQSLDSWDMSQVTNAYSMFWGATAFNQSLDSWDMSRVTDTSYMFMHASSFNQPLNSWHMPRLTDSKDMFGFATAMQKKNKPTACLIAAAAQAAAEEAARLKAEEEAAAAAAATQAAADATAANWQKGIHPWYSERNGVDWGDVLLKLNGRPHEAFGRGRQTMTWTRQ